MRYSALETIPQLSGKSREVRLLFAEVANEALTQGRTQDEAIFKALAAVNQLERQAVKKYVRPTVPSHLQAILDLKGQPAYVEPTPEPEKVAQEITSASFDADGRLTLKMSDGKKVVSNVAPITAIQNSVVVVNGTSDTALNEDISVDGGAASSVFQPVEVIDGGASV